MASQIESENRGPGLMAYNIVMICIAIIAVALRFWSRTLGASGKRGRFWWDDWVALAALPVSVASNVGTIIMIHFGVGKHISTLSGSDVELALKTLFANYIIYDTALTLAKSSAVFFYFRIFEKHSRSFAIALWVTQGLIWAWWLGICLGTVLMCDPVEKNYKTTLPGHCGDTGTLWVASAIPSVIIDFIILLLPIPMLWRLKLKLDRKVLLIGTFICGYSVVVISIGRLVTVLKDEELLNEDLTWYGVDSLYWLNAESPILILSICLPSLLALYHRARKEGTASLFTSQSQTTRMKFQNTTGNSHPGLDSRDGELSKSSRGRSFDGTDFNRHSTSVHTINRPDENADPENVPPAAIHVHNDYSVSRW